MDPEKIFPPIRIKKELQENYVNLYKGIRSKEDPISWRTLIIEIKRLLGSSRPELNSLQPKLFVKAKKLVNFLIRDTYLEKLEDEILFALGFSKKIDYKNDPLDCLFFSGRHYAETLLWDLAKEFKKRRKSVAVINPVGHYSDWQSRIMSIGTLKKYVDKLIIVSSTQERYGGNVAVLANVIRTLRSKDFAGSIGEVDIVIPMFGGSRGHRLGQVEEIGFEVLEAVFNAKILALVARDVANEVNTEVGEIAPKIRFFTVDIHNKEYPTKIFQDLGFDFIPVSPSIAFANVAYRYLKKKKLLDYPMRLIACDKGAIERTEKLAENLLKHHNNNLTNLEIVYLEKERKKAGVIKDVKIKVICQWYRRKDYIVKKIIQKDYRKVDYSEFVLFYTDDMIDTGGTAANDIKLLATKYPNTKLKIMAATHPVLSKGIGVLEDIGADTYLLGNTLNPDGLDNHPKVIMVNMATEIYKAIKRGVG